MTPRPFTTRSDLLLVCLLVAHAATFVLDAAPAEPPEPPGRDLQVIERDDAPDQAANDADEIEPEVDHETRAETIAKCLADLKSDDLDVRRRAILILGKYETPAALAAILNALQDADDRIRRSAVVSIVERQLFSVAAEPLLPMLGDDDVHIRRIVSTFIVPIFLQLRRFSPGRSSDLDPEHAALIRRAFRDPDPTVRKNMLNAFNFFRDILGADILEPLLADDDTLIRIQAIRHAGSLFRFEPEHFVEMTAGLVDDPAIDVRRQLATQLASLGKSPEVRRTLEKLVDDADFRIATEARLGLLEQGDHDQVEPLLAILDRPRTTTDLAQRIIQAVATLPRQGVPALLTLMQHDRAEYRAAAIEQYTRYYRRELDPTILWKMVEDPHPGVRIEAGRALRLLDDKLRLEDFADRVRDLATSRYPDNRSLAGDLTSRLTDEESLDVLMELLLDDNAKVRGEAIADLVRRRLGDWQQIARISLEDEQYAIREATLNAVLSRLDPTSRPIIEDFIRQTPDRLLRQRAQTRLDRDKQL